jgi:hypothetical protein
MLERYERIISAPTPKIATYVNEMTDSIKMVASLGREREVVRVLGLQTQSAPKGTRFLILGCSGLALGKGVALGTGALMFYWFSRRLADGAVRTFALVGTPADSKTEFATPEWKRCICGFRIHRHRPDVSHPSVDLCRRLCTSDTLVQDYPGAFESSKSLRSRRLILAQILRLGCDVNQDTRLATDPSKPSIFPLNGRPGISSCMCELADHLRV